MNEEIKFVKRKDEDYIYAATPALLKREDMHVCDSKGRLLDVISVAEATGLKPKRPETEQSTAFLVQNQFDTIAQTIAKVLNISEGMAKEIMQGHVMRAGDMPDMVDHGADSKESEKDETEETKETDAVRLQDMNREKMVVYAKAEFGDKADHLNPDMPRQTLIDEIEALQIGADIEAEDK